MSAARILILTSGTLSRNPRPLKEALTLARHGYAVTVVTGFESAKLLAGLPALRLPVDDFRLLPTDAECRAPTAALHHYVSESKRGYFRHAWRHIQP